MTVVSKLIEIKIDKIAELLELEDSELTKKRLKVQLDLLQKAATVITEEIQGTLSRFNEWEKFTNCIAVELSAEQSMFFH
jgi:hypothetical protein